LDAYLRALIARGAAAAARAAADSTPNIDFANLYFDHPLMTV
jgi:hypothetical protein